MTRKQFRDHADRLYANDILTPLERRRKALMGHQKLSKEKIGEVQRLLAGGTKKADIIEQTGVSASTVDRIKNGVLTAEGHIAQPPKPETADKPEHYITAHVTTPDVLTERDVRVLHALCEQAERTLQGADGNTAADTALINTAIGILTAAQLILGGGAE